MFAQRINKICKTTALVGNFDAVYKHQKQY